MLCFVVIGVTTHAQQQNYYAFYRQNMNIYNPAFAGAEGNTTLVGIYKSQWEGVKDAPESQAFSFGTYAGKRVGIGLSVVNDVTFVEEQMSVNADFSYVLPLSEQTNLFLGLKAGGNFYNLNVSGIETWSYEVDPSLIGFSRFNPNLGVGAYLKNGNYFISLSAPRIFATERAREEEGVFTTAADRPHFYLAGGYFFRLSSSLVLEPTTMVRYVKGAPVSVDVTAILRLEERFGIGAGYRTDKSLYVLTLIQVVDWLQAGYAYESALRSEITDVSSGSHELFVNFELD